MVYPGLPDHPQHHVLAKLRNAEYGWGGLLTVNMGSQKAAGIFMERLQNKHGFGFMAVSLGYFDTLMSCSGATTSSELSEDERLSAGLPSPMDHNFICQCFKSFVIVVNYYIRWYPNLLALVNVTLQGMWP